MPCAICLEKIQLPFLQNDGLHLPWCHHNFHSKCILPWFEKINALVCPYCKQTPTEEDSFIYELQHAISRFYWKTVRLPKYREQPNILLNFRLWFEDNKSNIGPDYPTLRAIIYNGCDIKQFEDIFYQISDRYETQEKINKSRIDQ